MTVSSYIKRQSRTRTRKSTLPLTSIVEEPVEETAPKTKKNSEKARRRHGISNLFIPRASSLFTAVQGDPADWRLTLDDADTFEFPRPPPFDEGESSGSSSGSDSSPASSLPTTPTPSPTAETHGQCIIRCKSIKPLTINKRSVSPAPPPVCAPAPEEKDAGDHTWEDEDDDEFYAAHARSFITLAPPLPASFPASTSTRALHRESTIIPASVSSSAPAPHRASVRLSRAISIPARAPPPPPIITSHAHSRSASTTSINYSRPLPVRPPPRTPVPTDALSGDYATDYAAYLPLLLSPSNSRTPSPSSSTSSRLAALLSPPPFPAEAQGVPADVDAADGWEDEACDLFYDEVPLSPLVAPSPTSASPSPAPASPIPASPLEDGEAGVDNDDTPAPPQLLALPPYTGWHPRPRASQLRLAALAAEAEAAQSPSCAPSAFLAPSPQLRSRWSSSTLSSVHSAHAQHVSSPKTFAFARRYFPKPKSSSPSSPSPFSSSSSPTQSLAARARVRPMGSTSATVAKGGKGKKGKKLTVADVNVLVVGRPEAQSVLACASPDVFAAPAPFLSPSSALSPATPGAQWASYPASPSPYALGHAHSASTPSPALYAAYTTQRSPRRRASTASNATGWSYSSSSNSGHSGSGQSDAGSDASAGSGLRRKPIPVEMFLR